MKRKTRLQELVEKQWDEAARISIEGKGPRD